jgi:UDPglucose 6-dehydrogenase
MNIVMIGTGYVGLTTGVCLAHIGHNVTCIEIDQQKLAKLRNGEVTFYEPGLDTLMQDALAADRLRFDSAIESHIADAELFFIAVQTPQGEDGRANLTFVETVAKNLGVAFAKHAPTNRPIVVNKSTVPVGTGQLVRDIIAKEFDGEFDVVSNPEFLREGSAVDDFLKPDRVVVGSDSEHAAAQMTALYEPIIAPKLFTTIESAEMIKYASNAFLATKISFINEIANVCENTGADVKMVAQGMGMDNRIGPKFLNAGLGYGGSCFPKDVRALHSIALTNGYTFHLLKAVIEVNNTQRKRIIDKMADMLGGDLHGKTIALYGLAFKDNTDDVRESAAIDLIHWLREMGADVRAYDPQAIPNAKAMIGDACTYADDPYTAAEGADALIVATEWPEFTTYDFGKIKKLLNQPYIFDGKNLLDKDALEALGFTYVGVGRPSSSSSDVQATTALPVS